MSSDTIPAAASISGDITRRRWLPSITCCQPHNSNKVHLCSNITHCNQQLHREESREQRAQRSSPANSSSRHERGVPVGDYWERKSLEPFLCFPLSLFVFICLFVETKTRFKTTPPTLIKYCHYCNMLAITFFPSLWKSILLFR